MKTLFKIVCLCAVITACKKSENTKPTGDPVPTQKSKREMLTDGKWVRVCGYYTYLDTHAHKNATVCIQYDSCGLDDTMSFTSATNKMVVDMGKNQCKGMPFVVDSNSSWVLANNGEVLNTFGGFLPNENYVIEQLTCDTLIWHYGFPNVTSNQTTVIYKNLR